MIGESPQGPRKQRTCLIEHPSAIVTLRYQVTRGKIKLPPESVLSSEGMPVYPLTRAKIPPKSHIMVQTGISLDIPPQSVALLTADPNPSPQEPLVCLGFLTRHTPRILFCLCATLQITL